MLEQLFYCHVPMSHLENAIKWYKEILHSEEERQAQLNFPSGQMLFLVESTHQATATFKVNTQTHPVIAFQCMHIKALANHLKRNTVKVDNIMDDRLSNLFLDFYDSDGNKFNVQCDKF
ncbi:VOC family protein [Shouchella clausii]|uniref:Glyoxalase/bleomycin resistance/dioxygenase family protein n=2 Tax=Shouchella clausii TaxID=79880 RepID=A0A268P267_SHOCL|nr:VOC family protein [Shouchella clausii]MDO7267933.1 VOC family protein [Shouchella clausii]MDO7287114.1 VOC family protein [Shouchella clausii]PAE89778.1 glyoxalase/bleomycin resistance/dioxygenase family protein [Shouchella clausii]